MNGGSSTISAHDILQERIEEMPENYMPAPSSTTGSHEEGGRETMFFLMPFKFPLLQLKVSGRTFLPSKPISVQIAQDGEWFFAENEALRVVGSGRSFEEAVFDLEQHIVHFWEYYKSLQDSQVIGDAVRLKNVYSHLLQELA